MIPPSGTPGAHQRFFISHSSRDAALARMLVSALEGAGVPCWVAPRDVIAGEEYPTALAKAIDGCAVFLLLYTQHADASAQVCNEIERAASGGKPILLVRADQTDPAKNTRTGFFLQRHHWFDASSGPLEQFLPQILYAAQQTLHRVQSSQPSAFAAPAATPAPSESPTRSIGVGIERSHVRAYVVDMDGDEPTMTFERNVELGESGNARTVLREVQDLIQTIIDEQFRETKPLGIGVAAPGQVDVRAGVLKFGPNLFSARNVPFKSSLARSFPTVPVRVDNDVRCAARCEMHMGVARGFDSFACVFVGSGVGSAAVVERRVHFGHNFCAGEIGHTKISPTGPPCSCGQIGCLEAFIKTQAVVERARAKAIDWQTRGKKTELSAHGDKLSPQLLLEAMENGDEAALEIAGEAAEHLGLGVANYLNLLNPAAVIIAGGLMMGFFLHMVDQVTSAVQRNALAEVANTPIVQSAHEETGVGLGAALLFHPEEHWPF